MRKEATGMLFIGGTVFLWSMIEVITKLMHSALPPLTIAYLRFLLGGIFLLPVAFFFGRKVKWAAVGWRDWTALFLVSFLGISCTFSLFHIALYWIDASSTATLIAMVPLFVTPLSIVFLNEKVGVIGISGILMGGAGILLIYFSEESAITSVYAICLVLIAVSCFSIYAVLMKPLNRKMDPKVTTSISLFLGGVMMIPILIFDGSPLIRPMGLSTWCLLLFLSFVTVGVAYLLYFMGLERVRVSTGNSLMYLKPLIATGLAWVILKEVPSIMRVVAILLVSISVFLVVREKWIAGRFKQRGKFD
ncbi:MAG: DMT family transporter [Candidatus Thermoplasmatota archaeon]|nr:DMT family transporter [Candidatus Thermoplasmatota archaeon]